MYIWGISLHRIGFRTRRRIRYQTAETAITHYSQCPDQPIAQPNETAELAPNNRRRTGYRYGGNGGNFLKYLVFSMVLGDAISDFMKIVPGY